MPNTAGHWFVPNWVAIAIWALAWAMGIAFVAGSIWFFVTLYRAIRSMWGI